MIRQGEDGPEGAIERHVVVLGPMAVGKTTTAQHLADDLGMRHVDGDRELERRTGGTGRRVAADRGVAGLHKLEQRVLLDALADTEPSVISAAASVVDDPACREVLGRRAFVVVLSAPIDVLLARAQTGSHRRPIDESELVELTERRRPLFASVADLSLDATEPVDTLVGRIAEALAEHVQTRRLR